MSSILIAPNTRSLFIYLADQIAIQFSFSNLQGFLNYKVREFISHQFRNFRRIKNLHSECINLFAITHNEAFLNNIAKYSLPSELMLTKVEQLPPEAID